MTTQDRKVFAFLDTNILIEFKDIEQINWTEVLGYAHGVLVLAPVIFRELDTFKYDQKSERRQSRSRKITKRLDDLLATVEPPQEAPVKANLTLLALTNSPRIDDHPGLDHRVNDDQLIASVLDFSADNADVTPDDVLLITDDTGCRNKARSRGIQVHRLADEYRLPNEHSAVEKELKRTQQQLAKLQNLQPKLSLRIAGELKQAADLDVTLLRKPNAAELDALCAAEEHQTAWKRPGSAGQENRPEDETPHQGIGRIAALHGHAFPLAWHTASDREVDRYNQQREQYLRALRQYQTDLYTYKEAQQRIWEAQFVVINDGTTPAKDVRIHVVVPDTIAVFTLDNIQRAPEKPQRPALPRTEIELVQASMSIRLPMLEAVGGPDPRNIWDMRDLDDPEPDITVLAPDRVRVEWRRSTIMHHMPLSLHPFMLQFPPEPGIKHYTLSYKLFAENIPEPVQGTITLHVTGTTQAYTVPR